MVIIVNRALAKAVGIMVSGNSNEYLRSLLMMSCHLLERGGSPGGIVHENLMSVLVKSFNPNRREFRIPE